MDRLIIFVITFLIYAIYRVMRGRDQGSDTFKTTTYTGKSYPFSDISADPNFPQARSIRTKVRGVTKRNQNGEDRQRIIRQSCRSGDALCLVREPTNPVDPNAVQVLRIVCPDAPDKPQRGEQIGYISRELAEDLAPRMDNDGCVLMAEILEVTGSGDGEAVGVNIEIAVYEPASRVAPTQQLKKRNPRRKLNAEMPPPA